MRRDQSRFLDALDLLPRTLCHLDVHPGNLFAEADGSTVAIDWAFVGIGAIGEDAGNLVPDAVLDFHIPAAVIDDLCETVAAWYAAGLAHAGWSDPRSFARLGMAATIAAKYAWIPPAILKSTGFVPRSRSVFTCPQRPHTVTPGQLVTRRRPSPACQQVQLNAIRTPT